MASSTENTADTGGKTTALTPKEAFQHIKALWPKVAFIQEHKQDAKGYSSSGDIIVWCSNVHVDWGTEKQYPAPPKVWRPATPADVTYPHKECRLRDTASDEWQHAKLIGLAYRSDRIVWVGSQYINFHYWQCEVCD